MTAPTPATPTRHVREPQFRHLQLFGHRIRVAVWYGSAGRVPLLLFNGIGANVELLAPIADCLADVEVIAFDAPGVGGSGPACSPYRPWQYALLTTRLLDKLGYRRKVDVLGVSWGGAMAQQLAFQARRRVRRLVLAGRRDRIVPPINGRILASLMPRARLQIAGHAGHADDRRVSGCRLSARLSQSRTISNRSGLPAGADFMW